MTRRLSNEDYCQHGFFFFFLLVFIGLSVHISDFLPTVRGQPMTGPLSVRNDEFLARLFAKSSLSNVEEARDHLYAKDQRQPWGLNTDRPSVSEFFFHFVKWQHTQTPNIDPQLVIELFDSDR